MQKICLCYIINIKFHNRKVIVVPLFVSIKSVDPSVVALFNLVTIINFITGKMDTEIRIIVSNSGNIIFAPQIDVVLQVRSPK